MVEPLQRGTEITQLQGRFFWNAKETRWAGCNNSGCPSTCLSGSGEILRPIKGLPEVRHSVMLAE